MHVSWSKPRRTCKLHKEGARTVNLTQHLLALRQPFRHCAVHFFSSYLDLFVNHQILLAWCTFEYQISLSTAEECEMLFVHVSHEEDGRFRHNTKTHFLSGGVLIITLILRLCLRQRRFLCFIYIASSYWHHICWQKMFCYFKKVNFIENTGKESH